MSAAPIRVKYRPTGETMTLSVIPPEDAAPALQFRRDGTMQGKEKVTHFARNEFRSWSGCKTDFEANFLRI